MKKINFLLVWCIIFLWSCKKNNNVPNDSCTIEITHQLKNPYSIPTETHLQKTEITHHYVRFKIHSIEQYQALEKQGVFLLDHPFDAAPDNQLNYKTEHTKAYGVYYGVAPSSLNISSYDAEIISNLAQKETSATLRKNTGYAKHFSGRVTFFDPIDSTFVPLKGIQVVIKDVTNFTTATTNEDGQFNVTSSDIISDTVEVLIKFDNDYLEIHTLDMANLLGIFGVNTFSLGFKKSCAFTDLNVEIGRSFNNAALHHSCATLLAFNEYKKFAADFGFMMPDKKFLFWLGKDAPISTSYATPMLRNMTLQGIANPTELISNLFGIPTILAQPLAIAIKDQLPDVYAPFYMPYSTAARASFIEVLFHELSHAAHYAKVGPVFWKPYVEYIYQHGGYGEKSFSNSGIISLSEAWAEDASNMCAYYIYKQQKFLNWNENPTSNWIPYGLYYDLYDTGNNEPFDQVSGITFTQIYSLFSSDVQSLTALKIKLKAAFPAQQNAIEILFNHYGF